MNRLVVFLMGYAVFAGLVLWVFMCGQNPANEGSLANRLYELFTQTLWRRLGRVLTRCGLGRCVRCCGRCQDYVCNQRNPLTQILYLLLVVPGCLACLYYSAAFPPGPGSHIGAVVALCVAALAAFAKASFSDPGTITKDNLPLFQATYRPDNILYSEKSPKFCKVCGIPRPPRSRHCKYCNRCVALQDHHCPWVNTCVAERNFRWFVLFLLTSAVYCLYGAYYLLTLAAGILDRNGILHNTVIPREGRPPLVVNFWLKLRFVTMHTRFLVPLALFAVVMGVMLLFFGLYQIYVAGTGKTSAEYTKLYYIRLDTGEPAPFLYSRGFFRNIADMLFPPSLHGKVSKPQNAKNVKARKSTKAKKE